MSTTNRRAAAPLRASPSARTYASACRWYTATASVCAVSAAGLTPAAGKAGADPGSRIRYPSTARPPSAAISRASAMCCCAAASRSAHSRSRPAVRSMSARRLSAGGGGADFPVASTPPSPARRSMSAIDSRAATSTSRRSVMTVPRPRRAGDVRGCTRRAGSARIRWPRGSVPDRWRAAPSTAASYRSCRPDGQRRVDEQSHLPGPGPAQIDRQLGVVRPTAAHGR